MRGDAITAPGGAGGSGPLDDRPGAATVARPGGATIAAVLAATTVCAAMIHVALVRDPDLIAFETDFSAATVLALSMAAVLCILFFLKRDLGLVVLSALVFVNLSEILVRFHDMPSMLQLLFAPLALAALVWAEPRRAWRRLANPLGVLLALYALLLVLSTTWARDPGVADERLVEMLKATGVFVLLAALATSTEGLRKAAWGLTVVAVVPAGLGVYQVLAGAAGNEFGGLARIKNAQIYGDVFEPRIAGTLGDPNFFAQLLLIVVPVAAMLLKNASSLRRRVVATLCLGVIVAGTVLTYSRGAALALGLVTLMLLSVLRVDRRKLAMGAVIGLVLLAALLPTDFARRLATIEQLLPGGDEVLEPDSSFAKRRLVTRLAWLMALDHPLLGVGAGNYAVHFDDYAAEVDSASRQYTDPGGDERQYPHNLYLETAAETGLVGLALLGTALVACFVLLRRACDAFRAGGDTASADLATALVIGLAGYLVCGLFLHLAFPRPLWLLFAFAAALYGLSRTEPVREQGS